MDPKIVICVFVALLAILPQDVLGRNRVGQSRGISLPNCKVFQRAFKEKALEMIKYRSANFERCPSSYEDDEGYKECTFRNLMLVKDQMKLSAGQKCAEQVELIYLRSANGSDVESEY